MNMIMTMLMMFVAVILKNYGLFSFLFTYLFFIVFFSDASLVALHDG